MNDRHVRVLRAAAKAARSRLASHRGAHPEGRGPESRPGATLADRAVHADRRLREAESRAQAVRASGRRRADASAAGAARAARVVDERVPAAAALERGADGALRLPPS